MHAAAEVILYIGKPIRQCKGQLGYGVGTSFGYVITTDADAVEISHLVFYKVFLHIAH